MMMVMALSDMRGAAHGAALSAGSGIPPRPPPPSPPLPQPPHRSVRPTARPNPGFMAALLELDERLHGARSVRPGALLLKRGKPAARVCPVCAEAVGVSLGSLKVHLQRHHRDASAAGRLLGAEGW